MTRTSERTVSSLVSYQLSATDLPHLFSNLTYRVLVRNRFSLFHFYLYGRSENWLLASSKISSRPILHSLPATSIVFKENNRVFAFIRLASRIPSPVVLPFLEWFTTYERVFIRGATNFFLVDRGHPLFRISRRSSCQEFRNRWLSRSSECHWHRGCQPTTCRNKRVRAKLLSSPTASANFAIVLYKRNVNRPSWFR